MTLATMADRALPLAERAEAWYWSERTDRGASGYQDAVDALLADIAAADRLARADWAVFEAALRGEPHSPAKRLEYEDALDAYRARIKTRVSVVGERWNGQSRGYPPAGGGNGAVKLQRWNVGRGGLDTADVFDDKGEWVRWADVLAWRDSIREAVRAEREAESRHVCAICDDSPVTTGGGPTYNTSRAVTVARAALDALLAGGGG